MRDVAGERVGKLENYQRVRQEAGGRNWKAGKKNRTAGERKREKKQKKQNRVTSWCRQC